MPPHLRLTALSDFMPDAVLDEIIAIGDPSIAGWGPLLTQWINTSTHWRVERWRNDLRAYAAKRYGAALNEALTMADLAKQLYLDQKGTIRTAAVIHPDLHAFNEDRLSGRALEKEKRESPKLFIAYR